MMPSLLETLTGHPFLAGLPQAAVSGIADLAASYDLPEGYRLFAEGDPADRFYLLGHGRVALDLHVPGRGPVIVETLGGGAVIGWSWLCPPHRWRFGAVVLKPTQVVAVDGESMRAICDSDPIVGYEIARRLLTVVADRLHATRVRFLDLYAARPRDARDD
jgi:CRP/FNR family transcriptional regulator, cyclic AMP receptor protein